MTVALSQAGDVVISGVGAVSPCGWGATVLWKHLQAGTSKIREPHSFDTSRQRTRLCAEVPRAAPEVSERHVDWRRLSLADRYATAAGREACDQAGLELSGSQAGVFFSSSTAGLREGETYFARSLGYEKAPACLGLVRSHPLNSPGDAVARALGVQGPVESYSSACASGALAIRSAAQHLRAGEVEVAVAGGSDSLCLLTYSGFNSLRAVDASACRPFRADRAGLSIGEGAGVLLLETLEHCRRRGGRPLGLLLGSGGSCDAHHMTAPDENGDGAALAIRSALEDAGVDATAVTFISAHGTGTALNDVSEWKALLQVFGELAGQIPVCATKTLIGHFLGSAGAIEAVATMLCLRAGLVHPVPFDGEVDAHSPVRLVQGRPLPIDRGAIGLSTSFAFGGANAALLMTGWDEDRVA